MKIRIPLAVVAMLISLAAQSQLKLAGSIADQQKTPVSGVSILIHPENGGADFQTVTNKKGTFSIDVDKKTVYLLKLSHIGYAAQSIKVKTEKADLDLSFITLLPNIDLLSEITVKSKKAAVRQKNDTLEFSSSAYKVNQDASAEDLVRKLPGISMESGVVKAQGEDVKKVTIDGREFFGDDATAALKNLPAEIIDKIQVFDRMSESAQLTGFDDGNSAKSINIITKAEMRNGRFGRVSGGYGTSKTYNAGGNLSYYSGKQRISLLGLTNNVNQQNFSSQDIVGISQASGKKTKAPKPDAGKNAANFSVGPKSGLNSTTATGINFSDVYAKKIELTASYFFNHSDNNNEEVSSRTSFTGGDNALNYQENRMTTGSANEHRLNIRAEYKIDSVNTMILTSKDHIQKKSSSDDFEGSNASGSSVPFSHIMSSTNGTNAATHFNNSLVFKHQFGKAGRSLVLEYSDEREKSTGVKNLRNRNEYLESGFTVTDSLEQYINQQQRSVERSADITYTEPFGKKSLLMLHLSPKSDKEAFNRDTYSSDYQLSKSALPDSALSTSFTSSYLGHQGGLGFKIGSKENQFTLDLDYRAGRLEGNNRYATASLIRTYFNLLPGLNWKMRVSPASSVKVEFHSSVDLPAIDKMQDAVNNSEPLFFFRGNSSLVEQTSQKLSGRYTYINLKNGRSFFANLSAKKADNYFTNASFTAASDTLVGQNIILKKGGQVSMPVNMDGYLNLRSVFSVSLPLKQFKSVLSWNSGLQFVKTLGMVNGIKNLSQAQSYSSGLAVASNVSSFIDFTLSYSGNLSRVNNTIKPGTNEYFTQITNLRINLMSASGWLFQNDLTNQSYSGLSQGYNQHFTSWNMSAGKKFLKKQAGELKLSVFDLLKQNRNISRTVAETYIEDSRNLVLQQYFMLTFTYRFKAFAGSK